MFALYVNAQTANAQVNVQDSLALVDLYNSTNGPNWDNNSGWLTGPVSKWYGITVTDTRVTKISLVHNKLNGKIASSIGNLENLGSLSLGANQLSGSIPASIGKLVNLLSLSLAVNQLSGSIPASMGKLANLQLLNLYNNQLSGSIPSSISNLANLRSLDLSFNQLSSSIPASIGKLVNLRYLDLINNQLSGNIPNTIGNLAHLTHLYLSRNQLSGSIPASIGKLTNLYFILDLQQNQLSGSIPASIGNLKKLLYLWLNDNQLTDSIPSSIGNLVNLQYLVLSNNKLSGPIPSSFGNLSIPRREDEGILRLSNNYFTFDGMELVAQKFPDAEYSPQANIPVHQNDDTLSVYAGGTLGNNTYEWFDLGKKLNKNTAKKEDSTIIKGDSVFYPDKKGIYFVKVTNSIATQLTLQSDTIYYDPHAKPVIVAGENVLQENDKTNAFLVYPNPARNILYVQTNSNASFSLLNQSGKILLTTSNINGKGSINVSGIGAGLYYLKNNITDAVQKVIIAR